MDEENKVVKEENLSSMHKKQVAVWVAIALIFDYCCG
jgi:hypothetical protein